MDYVLKYATHFKLSSQHGWEDLYEHENIYFDDEQNIHTNYEKVWNKWMWTRLEVVDHLALIMCFVSYQKTLIGA